MKLDPRVLKISFFFILIITSSNGFAQIKMSDWYKETLPKMEGNQVRVSTQLPLNYSAWRISTQNFLNNMDTRGDMSQEIVIPSPNGEFEKYIIKPSKVVADHVAHLYSIKTFMGYKKDNPNTLISCDISNGGFHAAIYEKENTFFIEPMNSNSSERVISYYKKDNISKKLNCKTQTASIKKRTQNTISSTSSATTKRTYRLAIAAAGEYSQEFGGSPFSETNVLNALASGVNMINPIFLRDLGVEFKLVSTSKLVYKDPNTDPFLITDKDDADASHLACMDALGSSGFDVGHMVVWANTGGAAGFKVVCDTDSKGAGYSGSSQSLTSLWVDYVTHELGHQFGSEHNFVSQECGTSASDFRYEPGEGSSLMSYAGVCDAAAQYATQSDPFFHYASIAQMQTYIKSTSCAVTNSSGNTASPVANASADITIPKSTPFILVGSGTDANDAASKLTYNWVQYDGSSPAVTGSPNCSSTNAPMFRFRPPVLENYRSFPQYSDVLTGINDQQWEKLPCVARTMNFSLTVRDNNMSFGRIGEDKALVTVANTGPFNVTSPNGGEALIGNNSYKVNWTVNGTDSHCNNVDILLSIDGGATYSVVKDATANDGSESITLPNNTTTKARILVRCDVSGGFRSASTFYDVSNGDFNITKDPLSVDNIEVFDISIYVYPATNEIFIKLINTENYLYRVIDALGRSVLKGAFNNSINIDTSSLPTGLYFLEIHQKNTNKTGVRKIIIQ